MAKFALIFVGLFLIVQIVSSAELHKRDTESTTPSIIDNIKSGVESTFSEQNIKKAVENINEFGDKLKVLKN